VQRSVMTKDEARGTAQRYTTIVKNQSGRPTPLAHFRSLADNATERMTPAATISTDTGREDLLDFRSCSSEAPSASRRHGHRRRALRPAAGTGLAGGLRQACSMLSDRALMRERLENMRAV